jgi:hypothetical protein
MDDGKGTLPRIRASKNSPWLWFPLGAFFATFQRSPDALAKNAYQFSG